MKPGFTILDHPADVGIEAHGAGLGEAFEQAAVGLMSVIVDPATVHPHAERSVELRGADLEHLLVKRLTEILYLHDGEGFVGKEFLIEELSDTTLRAAVRGEPIDRKRHATRIDVKAVTYHQLLVRKNANGATVRVFLDI